MRNLRVIVMLLPVICACAQSKEEREAMANTVQLEQAVFGSSKDSLKLEELFAKNATYMHSSGKVESRDEAIRNIVQNKSVYTKIDTPINYRSERINDSVITNHPFIAKEKKADGSESMLRLNLELVWVKEDGKWKLYRRKATRIQ